MHRDRNHGYAPTPSLQRDENDGIFEEFRYRFEWILLEGGGMIRVGSKIEGRAKESFESHRDFFDSLENYKSTRRVLLIYSTIIIRLKIDRKIDILRNN